MTLQYQGACFCKKVKFELEDEPLFTQYCHCNKCREIASLSDRTEDKVGYSFTAAYFKDKFKITLGSNLLKKQARNTADLFLCSAGNSLIYGISQDPSKQAAIGINANNIMFSDGVFPLSFKANKHIWYQDRIGDINDDLPKYKDAPIEQFGSGQLWENNKL